MFILINNNQKAGKGTGIDSDSKKTNATFSEDKFDVFQLK